MIDFFTNLMLNCYSSMVPFFSSFFTPVTVKIIFGLLVLEIISYFCLPRSTFKNKLKFVFQIKDPFRVLFILVWVILFILSAIYSNNISPVSYTFVIAGIGAYIVGWILRHQGYVLDILSKHVIWIRPFLHNYSTILRRLEFNFLDSRLFGPWFEIVGISLIVKSIIVIPSYFVTPVFLVMAIRYEAKQRATQDQHIKVPTIKDITKTGHILILTLVPLLIATIIAIFTREFTVFNADIQTARSVLFTLSQIEGSVGILTITVIFVLTQLTAVNYSTRIPVLLFRQRAFWVPLIILLASIIYNLVLVSRFLPSYAPAEGNFSDFFIDVSFLLALLAACSITYFIFKAPRMVAPETIIADSLKGFNKDWLGVIKNDWGRPKFELKLNVRYDPFIVIERILIRAVDSGDNVTFISALILIRDHLREWATIDPREFPDYLIELDAYLRHHLRSLIRKAAGNSDAYTLSQLLNFIGELGYPSPESITKCDTFAFDSDEAPGELLLREIIKNADENHLAECVVTGIHMVEERASKVIGTFPNQTETWLYNEMKTEPEPIKEQHDKIQKNDFRIERFERQYLTYLQYVGVKAAESKSDDIVRKISLSLTVILSSLIQQVNGDSMKFKLVRQTLWGLSEIGKAADKNKIRHTMSLSMLEYSAEHIKKEGEEALAWLLVHYVSDILINRAKVGLLISSEVVSAAMFGIRIAEKYSKPAMRLIESFGEAAGILKHGHDFSIDKEMGWAYSEIISRIRQIRQCSASNKDFEQISLKVKSILQNLDEPEFDQSKGN